MTPEQYREKWGLPPDYPMVAPKYAKPARSSPSRWGSASSAAAARIAVESRMRQLVQRCNTPITRLAKLSRSAITAST